MHYPFWVAGARAVVQRLLAFGNHTRAWSVEEGRTRPGHALPRHSRHVGPLIRPETAKSASSQGEALALDGREPTTLKIELKDMIMEFSS